MKRIVINDITLRDGEQAPGVNFFPEEKLRIATKLAEMRIPVIEAGFAIASQSDWDAIRLIAKELGTSDGPVICAMARGIKQDIDRAADALAPAAKRRIQVVLPTSDLHIKHKFDKSKEEILDIAHETVSYAKTLANDVEFAGEDATRSELSYLIKVYRACVEAGALTLEIPDTVGYATPESYGNIVRQVVESVPSHIVVGTHCHNDLGLAVANTLSGIMNGARQAECTVNGIGERAGNASLEEVIMALKVRQDQYDVEIPFNTKKIIELSRLVAELSHIDVSANKAIVGRNAFLHETGIHQHGLLMDKKTYQIIEPTDIGLEGYDLVLGKLSGRHALSSKLEEWGYHLSEEVFLKIFEQFKILASKKKLLVKQDLINLIERF